jgi:hypothetical protein
MKTRNGECRGYAHHELFGLVLHVSRNERRQIERRSPIEGKIIFDHTVRNRRRHLLVWHLMAGQTFCGVLGPVYSCSEVISFVIRGEVDAGDSLKLRLLVTDLLGGSDAVDVHHGVCGWGQLAIEGWRGRRKSKSNEGRVPVAGRVRLLFTRWTSTGTSSCRS